MKTKCSKNTGLRKELEEEEEETERDKGISRRVFHAFEAIKALERALNF